MLGQLIRTCEPPDTHLESNISMLNTTIEFRISINIINGSDMMRD